MIGDVVDDADFAGDLLHRGQGLLHRLAPFNSIFRRFAGHAVGHLGALGILCDRGGHLLDRGAGFFDTGRLFAGGLANGLCCGAYFLRGGRQGIGSGQDFTQWAGDAHGDKRRDQRADHHRRDGQPNHQRARVVVGRPRRLSSLLGQFFFLRDQFGNQRLPLLVGRFHAAAHVGQRLVVFSVVGAQFDEPFHDRLGGLVRFLDLRQQRFFRVRNAARRLERFIQLTLGFEIALLLLLDRLHDARGRRGVRFQHEFHGAPVHFLGGIEQFHAMTNLHVVVVDDFVEMLLYLRHAAQGKPSKDAGK